MPFSVTPFFVFSLEFLLQQEPFDIILGNHVLGSIFPGFKFSCLNQPADLIVSKIQQHSCLLQIECCLGFINLQTRRYSFLLFPLNRGNLLR